MTYNDNKDVLTLDLRVQMRIAVFNYFQSQLRSHATHILSIGVTILVIFEILSRWNYQETLPIHLVFILAVFIVALVSLAYLLSRAILRWFIYARYTDIVTYADPVFKRGDSPVYFDPESHNPEHYMTYILNGTKQRDDDNRSGRLDELT